VTTLTEHNDWFAFFCQLEQQFPTTTTQANLASEWQINKQLLTQLDQYYPTSFNATEINASSNLWRLTLNNSWQVSMQLNVIGHDYINYQRDSSSSAQIANGIIITGDIASTSDEIADYSRVIDQTTGLTLHIIMPTFAQYDAVKASLVDTLSHFKSQTLTANAQLLLPYFYGDSTLLTIQNIFDEHNINELFAQSGQDFSGINSIEDFQLLTPANNNTISVNRAGTVSASANSSYNYQALTFVETAFESSSSSSSSGISISSGGEWSCNEELFAQVNWRPYFIIIEQSDQQLIYTMAENESPSFEDQSNLCSDDSSVNNPWGWEIIILENASIDYIEADADSENDETQNQSADEPDAAVEVDDSATGD